MKWVYIFILEIMFSDGWKSNEISYAYVHTAVV